MDVTTVVLLAIMSVVAAWLIVTRHGRDGLTQTRRPGPKTVKDSVPAELRGNSMSLQEREERAQRLNNRKPTPDGDTEKVADDDRRGDALADIDTDFAWTRCTDIDFDDVGGLEDVKGELRKSVILPLKQNSETAEAMGISATNVLLKGAPGTGKTYVSRALATELALPFAEVSGSDLQSKWINKSASQVASLFREAEEVAEKCDGAVIFLDEVDSVLSRRGGSNSHMEDSKVVNEFLNHLEETQQHDIVVIAATNRADMLDDAGVRSGRFDVTIEFEMPGECERARILEAQLSDRPHSVSEDVVQMVARETEGCSAADIASMVDDAARSAMLRGGEEITDEDMVAVVE